MALKVTTFSSKGRATRIYGYKTRKIHHLQSDNQLRMFLILEWNNKVIDIQENMELKDIELNINELDNLRLDEFMDKETGKLYKLHTNFLIKIRTNNQEEQVAISVKSISELQRKTVIEKIEIERRYWKAKKVRFYIITEKEINKQLVENIKWVREALEYNSFNIGEELAEKLYYFLQENMKYRISNILEEFDRIEKLKAGTALFIFRYLIGEKEIEINMKEKLDLDEYIQASIRF